MLEALTSTDAGRLGGYRRPGRCIDRIRGLHLRRAGTVLPMNARSLPAVLRTWARIQPNDPAFTYIDYDRDWEGVPTTLTWAQLYRRSLNVAQELTRVGSTGDRAVILAPQGLDYIVAFLGAMQAGRIAVPLSVPQGGASDERVDSVLRDASPVAVLTTSPSSTMSPGGSRPRTAPLPPRRSSRSIGWIWTLATDLAPETTTRTPRTCSTPRDRPASRPVSSSPTTICASTSNS